MTSLNEWIDMKIKDGNIDYVEYSEFSNVEKVGEGAFGIVNSAYWRSCGIKIAIKILINNSSVDENIMDEFVKELKNLKKVSFHPNINGFFGISKEPLSNKYAMVLEYADQGNLREYLKIHINNLKWSDKIRMASDIVCGLKCLHFKHIIHRDLHAKNILVNNHKLIIADFGSSKQLSEATSVSANSKNDVIGMIEYMEPQCFKNIEYKKTKKSDIYSLGVLLWEISSGRPPFLGYQRNILAFHIGFNNLREKPIDDDTPQDYQKLYQKCWDDEPNSRPDIERVYEILSQLKTENSSCLQSIQPSIIEIKNSNIDHNGDLSISDCLNLRS
ncbi:kinase-like protein [Rhizophagus irregularis]|uniref:Kinase-like protein n=2 Tax=Rhizophagus irregularis TaxID=588596 RepID=A0A2I1HQ92_9GLOM|nr:kinase-like protein [Rhizophagus irregularis]